MKINHIALWCSDLERMKDFYINYFNFSHNKKYVNSAKGFSSYFLKDNSGCRIEIMHNTNMEHTTLGQSHNKESHFAYAHIAISVGSEDAVNTLTESLRKGGYTIYGEARTTGDGYYESVILDPEGNKIEIQYRALLSI